MTRFRRQTIAFLIAILAVGTLLWNWQATEGNGQSSAAQGSPGARASQATAPEIGTRPTADQPSTTPVLHLPALAHAELLEEAREIEKAGRYRFATARRVDARPATHGRWGFYKIANTLLRIFLTLLPPPTLLGSEPSSMIIMTVRV